MARSTIRFALAAAGAALVVVALACGSGPMCRVCQRSECGNLTFTIRLQDRSKVETCCARCALHYLDSEKPAVASMTVRDFDTAEALDASSAVYVDGSDVTPCSAMHASTGPPRDERGCCMRPVYDRCLPSLLAFSTRDRALAFVREHGGKPTTFGELAAARGAQRGAGASGG